MSRLRYDYRGFHAQRFQAMQFPSKEDILVEFKAVPKAGLPDRAVLDAIVGFANASGGTLYIGIDDSGTVTGIPADCPKWLDPPGIEPFRAFRQIVRNGSIPGGSKLLRSKGRCLRFRFTARSS